MSTSRREIKRLLEISPEALFLEDPDGKILDVNERACKMLDYDKEELLNQEADKIVPDDHPVYLPGEIDEATRAGEMIETINLKKDGTEVPVELRGRLLELEGKRRVLVSIRNVAERKRMEEELRETNRELRRSQERYRSYFDELGDAIFVTAVGGENEGEILDVNRRAVEQTGYSRDELIGMNIEEDLSKGEPESISHEEADDKLSEGEMFSFREKKVRKDGTQYWTHVVVTPIEYEGRHASLSINRDVTAERRAKLSLREERDKLKSLHETVVRLQNLEEEEEVLWEAVEVAENMLEFELCAIAMLEGDYLIPKANSSNVEPEETATFKVGEGLAGRTIQRGETIWGEDVRNYPEAKPTKDDFRAFISVPIGELGTLQVISKEVGSFSRRDVRLAEILAGHLREEVKRVRAEQELREQATRDPLTGLFNRRYFNETLQKEVERSKRYEEPIAFVMTDVDRFKEINDRYSHQVGDEVLREVADLLRENVREADTVVRYGGDEFLIMLPETDGGVTSTVTRIERKLEEWNEGSDLIDFPIGLAFGVSHWSPGQERDIEATLKEADRKMYENKPDKSY
ncbi:MAG: diguanylate cyclase [Candidatus Bipolaricaulota bacterium]